MRFKVSQKSFCMTKRDVPVLYGATQKDVRHETRIPLVCPPRLCRRIMAFHLYGLLPNCAQRSDRGRVRSRAPLQRTTSRSKRPLNTVSFKERPASFSCTYVLPSQTCFKPSALAADYLQPVGSLEFEFQYCSSRINQHRNLIDG